MSPHTPGGHSLDLVITDAAPISNLLAHDFGGFDHKVISVELQSLCYRVKPKGQIHFKNLKNINHDILSLDLQQISSAKFSSASDFVDFYNKIMRSVLVLHSPVKTRMITFAQSAPGFTQELRKMKTDGHVLYLSNVSEVLSSLFTK